jgi:hypothetical protein
MISLEDVRRLSGELTTPGLSLYLRVDPGYLENQAATPAWRIWAKNAIRDLEANVADDQKAVWRAARAKAEAFLESYRAESKGLIYYASEADERTLALPLPFDNQAAFGEPLLTPLFWKIDEYERYLIVLVDQEEARFVTAYLGSAADEMTLETDLDRYTQATLNQAANRDAYKDMVDEYRRSFYRSVAAEIESLEREQQTTRIILGGASESAHAVRQQLPERLAAQIVDQVNIPMRTPNHELVKVIRPIAEAYERKFETELLSSVIDAARSGGRGALGRDAVLKMLDDQRVSLIVAPWPLRDEELLQSLPARSFQSGSQIEIVHGDAAVQLEEVGGIAARLHY